MATQATARTKSYGEGHTKTVPERFGHWLSNYQFLKVVPSFSGLRIGDFGCGYDAEFLRPHMDKVAHATLVDVSLAPDLKSRANVTAIEGPLPAALTGLPSASLDVVLCNNVLEHLVDPQGALVECRRLVKPTGVCFFNVPSWRGKYFLELVAFKLRWSAAAEIEDHKDYYEPRDLWRMLVRAGFRPSEITCRRHKFGMNTMAVCRLAPPA
jgi:2-polyprenyl-3-methyl-5-hydroxy-6-metoxy-1,4-benzoquinol methylase